MIRGTKADLSLTDIMFITIPIRVSDTPHVYRFQINSVYFIYFFATSG